MVYITCLKEKTILWKKKYVVFLLYWFVDICLLQCSCSSILGFSNFLANVFNYCHKMLFFFSFFFFKKRRFCRNPKSFSVSSKIKCMCKQSYSSAWQKITTGHCEFNVWPLYLIFKIWCQSTETQSIGEFKYELNTK